jgi:adenine deaminase
MKKPVIEQVYCRGILTAENGKILPEIQVAPMATVPLSMHVNLQKVNFAIPADKKRARVIEIVPEQVITHQLIEEITVKNNQAVSDPSKDLLKIAVIERHHGSGNIGKGFVKGLGLKKGALASSVAHDSHNIIVIGTNDEDMRAALEAVVQMGGGLAAVSDTKIRADLALPVAGLMSLEPIQSVRDQLDNLIRIAHDMGTPLKDPFMTLSFLALPVIPELKLTDIGLIDVNKFEVVPLFVE